MHTIAIIGAGPGGLVAARWLKKEGFEPVIFDRNQRVGGQWAADPLTSGVWPSMHTNTSRVLTEFSEFPHPPGTPTYPHNQQVQAYLQSYAEHFGLLPHLRLATAVDEIHQDERGTWIVRSTGADNVTCEQAFSHVVVASGRFNNPAIPPIPGLSTFTGPAGVKHTFAYKHPEQYRDLRVVVGGSAISALEIASDLAMLGAANVIASSRRQRYVLNKLIAGVPADHLLFTRFAALAGETFPPAVSLQHFKDFICAHCGSPEQFGAPKPADDVLAAGVTLSQFFLPLVAEGRIEIKPWITSVNRQTIQFSDGTSTEADGLLFATGYRLNLPFLSPALRQVLNVNPHTIDLYNLTFHPDLSGLAFIGLYEQIGPYFPALELQARWVAYTFAGVRPLPSRTQMEAGIAAYRSQPPGAQVLFHMAATHFAREAGIDPDPSRWPDLTRALLFGPLTPVSYRLEGRDSLPQASQLAAEAAATFGAVTSNQLTDQHCRQLEGLAKARNNEEFTKMVNTLTAAVKLATA